jgi:hypothetical protein
MSVFFALQLRSSFDSFWLHEKKGIFESTLFCLYDSSIAITRLSRGRFVINTASPQRLRHRPTFNPSLGCTFVDKTSIKDL